MSWNYRIGTKIHEPTGIRLFKIIEVYYNRHREPTSYGEPHTIVSEDSVAGIYGTIEQFNDMVSRDAPILDLDNWPNNFPVEKDHRFEHFLQKVMFFEKFENFQLYMSERGIHCFIIPDGYIHTNEPPTWRGFIAYQDETGKWIEDDLGCTSLHEIMIRLKKEAVELALERKIQW